MIRREGGLMPLLTWPWSDVYRAKSFGKKPIISGNPAIMRGRREDNEEDEG